MYETINVMEMMSSASKVTQIRLIHFFFGSAAAGAFFKLGLTSPPAFVGIPSWEKFSHLPSIWVGKSEFVS